MVKSRKRTIETSETFGTATLLSLPLGELKKHLNVTKEAIATLDDLLHTEMSYQRRIDRVMEVRKMMVLEDGCDE
tara:strand:+ start:107 stop:331 length:225 start_codon:yes stop_codon:yes gene_type:complete